MTNAGLVHFQAQVQALRDGKFEIKAAQLLVEALRAHVETGTFSWSQLGTTSVELDSILVKQRLAPLD